MSAFAATRPSATADSLRRLACQPKLAGLLASEGWTTNNFIEAIYRTLPRSGPDARSAKPAGK
jgi:hypothetical protein